MKLLYSWLEGDCLKKVADKFQISVEELCEFNGITNVTSIEAGDLLMIPSKGRVDV